MVGHIDIHPDPFQVRARQQTIIPIRVYFSIPLKWRIKSDDFSHVSLLQQISIGCLATNKDGDQEEAPKIFVPSHTSGDWNGLGVQLRITPTIASAASWLLASILDADWDRGTTAVRFRILHHFLDLLELA
jgi:hypothetical protein